MWISIWTWFALAVTCGAVSAGSDPLDVRAILGHSLQEHQSIDLAHWTPNMPRSHEDSQWGSDRDNNADDVAGQEQQDPGFVHATGASINGAPVAVLRLI